VREPAFSPDGNEIVFEGRVGHTPHVFTVPATGGETTDVTGALGFATAPDYSPDGERLTIAAPDPDAGGTTAIWTISTSGARAIPVARPSGAYGIYLDDPTFSPSGKSIAFVSDAPGMSPEIGLTKVGSDSIASPFATQPATYGSPPGSRRRSAATDGAERLRPR